MPPAFTHGLHFYITQQNKVPEIYATTLEKGFKHPGQSIWLQHMALATPCGTEMLTSSQAVKSACTGMAAPTVIKGQS